ncbi:MAG TPA: hypothetical protein VK173_01035 [Lacibacter sp.]|nr:hypothetical protein [Lacibacter sp.]
MKQLLTVYLLSFLFSCSEKRSSDAEDCYRLWSGVKPPKEINVLNGSYWQSAHFTKEYILFLEIKANDEWVKQFIKENKLIPTGGNWWQPDDTPEWFKPTQSSKQWKLPDQQSDSRYFEDTIAGKLFLYEIQL